MIKLPSPAFIGLRGLVCSIVMGIFGGGCTRAPMPEFVLSEKTRALPAAHQQQIGVELERLFGTPQQPRVPASDPAGSVPPDNGPSRERLIQGVTVYRQLCVGCHGETGDGQGIAASYLRPKPRDYRRGIFKFTSTPYGAKPARADLVRVIRRGAKGTSMPAFPWMSEEDIQAVIDYVILLSERGQVEELVAALAETDYDETEPIEDSVFAESLQTVQESWADAERQVVHPVTAQPPYDDESIRAGRRAFLSKGCSKCHGNDGKGQTEWLSPAFVEQQKNASASERIEINYDAWGDVAPAADLTARLLHGGRRPLDIYRRIHTGINGTPMPAFDQAFANEPETTWHLVHYVLSVVESRQVDFSDIQVEAP